MADDATAQMTWGDPSEWVTIAEDPDDVPIYPQWQISGPGPIQLPKDDQS